MIDLPEPKDSWLGAEMARDVQRVASVRARMEEDALTAEVIKVLRGKGYTVTGPTREGGWTAMPLSDPPDPGHPWHPCLQIAGALLGLETYFASEEDCLDFIHNEVLGAGEWTP